ncbi:MAG: hypothetical protein ACFFCS_04895 [Candidatus Hodarchaeota archaeon]
MGWFDFLKRKKDKEESPEGEKPELHDDVDDTSPAETPVFDPELAAILQDEFQLLKFLDTIYANPMLLLHRTKAREKYFDQMNAKLNTRPELKDILMQPERNVMAITKELLDEADKYASEHGISRSPQKFSCIVNLVILIPMLAFLVLGNLIPILQGITSIISIGGMCFFCMGSQFINRWILGKYQKFQDANLSAFVEVNKWRLEVIHDSIQEMLENMRALLVENDKDLKKIDFQLLNPDYMNIKVIDSMKIMGRNQFFYKVRFLEDDEEYEEYIHDPNADVDVDVDSDVDFDVDTATSDDDDIDDDVDE